MGGWEGGRVGDVCGSSPSSVVVNGSGQEELLVDVEPNHCAVPESSSSASSSSSSSSSSSWPPQSPQPPPPAKPKLPDIPMGQHAKNIRPRVAHKQRPISLPRCAATLGDPVALEHPHKARGEHVHVTSVTKTQCGGREGTRMSLMMNISALSHEVLLEGLKRDLPRDCARVML